MMNKLDTTIVISDNFNGYPLECFNVPKHMHDELEYVLIPGGMIKDRIEKIAFEIADNTQEPFIVLCVLKGGYYFFGELIGKLRQLHRHSIALGCSKYAHLEKIEIEFIRIKSYQNSSSTGAIKMIGIENVDSLRDKNILVVEDIIDTGRTIEKLLQLLNDVNVKSIKVASLFTKRNGFNARKPDFAGFELPDKFIVGINMDYNERYRDLNHICIMSKYGMLKYSEESSQK